MLGPQVSAWLSVGAPRLPIGFIGIPRIRLTDIRGPYKALKGLIRPSRALEDPKGPYKATKSLIGS